MNKTTFVILLFLMAIAFMAMDNSYKFEAKTPMFEILLEPPDNGLGKKSK